MPRRVYERKLCLDNWIEINILCVVYVPLPPYMYKCMYVEPNVCYIKVDIYLKMKIKESFLAYKD